MEYDTRVGVRGWGEDEDFEEGFCDFNGEIGSASSFRQFGLLSCLSHDNFVYPPVGRADGNYCDII